MAKAHSSSFSLAMILMEWENVSKECWEMMQRNGKSSIISWYNIATNTQPPKRRTQTSARRLTIFFGIAKAFKPNKTTVVVPCNRWAVALSVSVRLAKVKILLRHAQARWEVLSLWTSSLITPTSSKASWRSSWYKKKSPGYKSWTPHPSK